MAKDDYAVGAWWLIRGVHRRLLVGKVEATKFRGDYHYEGAFAAEVHLNKMQILGVISQRRFFVLGPDHFADLKSSFWAAERPDVFETRKVGWAAP
ncbi:hypothetical protein CTA1_874 [Colletotrichum tanaceti]|uniref:Uncharacterized protein n=1 Tax=Colletotrichum tanaceti TaxID=1306861 RepID=A0A4U6XTP9_9PEZI|nr:hypothetical protein CTA1_874 [Colletotrichum tanaceti]